MTGKEDCFATIFEAVDVVAEKVLIDVGEDLDVAAFGLLNAKSEEIKVAIEIVGIRESATGEFFSIKELVAREAIELGEELVVAWAFRESKEIIATGPGKDGKAKSHQIDQSPPEPRWAFWFFDVGLSGHA